ncbi:hypothetical protein EPA93_29190 [Ktedonosporobacter rubrisoli]|uniref:Uncharacterized protein n=1 Tax=Ktedonosporobacter rubrisoli TaxID=2509675 RepID=A0A4P6JWJ0_KTERU|nr:hypothetical protein [Ktedonosporobacter rubrisoli]QBD79835.1 hypothetical protein EPA93_29190 [Ktedonosporobacter rubrisoli]
MDRSERKTYRRSPGRQYGYEYDPLHSRGEHTSVPSRQLSGELKSRSGTLLSQRPDPRRTRQLLRQNIIASKARLGDEELEQEDLPVTTGHLRPVPDYDESEYETPYQRRHVTRSPQNGRHVSRQQVPSTQELMEAGEARDTLKDYEQLHPHEDYAEVYPEEPREYVERPPLRSAPLPSAPPAPRARASVPLQSPPERPSRRLPPALPPEDYAEEDDYDYDEEDEEEEPISRPRRRKKRKKLSRRALLVGAGAVAVGGAGVAAYELVPKIPQAISDAGTNLEHQLQEAFNKGVAQGADQVRKEFVTTLENLEGFTLEGAVTAARLTRVAYDVFVSPVIQTGATITGDFLEVMLKALQVGRDWLGRVYQDNATLAALQKVLESWVGDVKNMPKQLNAITQADLDGAQAYLRALQRKLDEEKAQLNGQKATPSAQSNPASKAQPTPKSK